MSSEASAQTGAGTAAPAAAPAAAAGGSKMMMIVAIVVVVVVVGAVVGYMFLSGGSIEGKWTFESAEVYDADGNLNETASEAFEQDDDSWIEFKTDGTVDMGGDSNGTWVTDGDTLTITTIYVMENQDYNITTGNITWDNETIEDSMVYTFDVSGSTLTLEFEIEGKTVKIIAKKA